MRKGLFKKATVRKVIYEGMELAAVSDETIKNLNILLKEASILEVIKECLGKFISKSLKEICPTEGKAWMYRFLSNQLERDSFVIAFQDFQYKHSHTSFATGRFLSKEIRFYTERQFPEYVKEKYIPFLREFFEKMGFRILKEREEFYQNMPEIPSMY